MLSLTTAEKNFYHDRISTEEDDDEFHYDRVPLEWMSDILFSETEDALSIHSYGINGKGKYFDRTRKYAMSEGGLKEVWRDDEKEVDKKDKDIGALCKDIAAIDETPDSYFLKNTCSPFKQGDIDKNFPLKSEILEDACFFHYKHFSQENVNKLCASYEYDTAAKRYSLLSDSELREKLKINIFPSQIENENVASIDNIVPAYFDSYKKKILTEQGIVEADQLKKEDEILIKDNAEDKNLYFLKLKNKVEITRDEEDGKIIPDSYLIIGEAPEKHIRLIAPTYLSFSKEMLACFLSKGEKWKLQESDAIYSVPGGRLKSLSVYSIPGLKLKIYSGILTNSSSGQTINRIVSADDNGNCAKLFEAKESSFLFIKTVIEIKDGKQVENWLVFSGATDLAVRYHENDNVVFSLANKKDYEYSLWIMR